MERTTTEELLVPMARTTKRFYIALIALLAGGGHYVGVIEKCTWCVHRVENGKKPACVEVCPAYALRFGDLDNPDNPNFDDVSKLIKQRPTFRLLEELGTQPRVYYISGGRK